MTMKNTTIYLGAAFGVFLIGLAWLVTGNFPWFLLGYYIGLFVGIYSTKQGDWGK